MTEPRQIAAIQNYAGLQKCLRARADELRMSRAVIGERAELAENYVGVLLGLGARNQMRVQTSIKLIRALGMTMLLVEDAEALKDLCDSVGTRSEKHHASRQARNPRRDEKRRFMRKLGRLGNAALMGKTTPEWRTRRATKAALIRWQRERRRKREARLATGCGGMPLPQ